jgi:hypothetical protein
MYYTVIKKKNGIKMTLFNTTLISFFSFFFLPSLRIFITFQSLIAERGAAGVVGLSYSSKVVVRGTEGFTVS